MQACDAGTSRVFSCALTLVNDRNPGQAHDQFQSTKETFQ
ncbi:hypothetical protein [Polaromonas sp. CG9_12]|nr:hypothetical protein [Polaromonas sp. CG9_12]